MIYCKYNKNVFSRYSFLLVIFITGLASCTSQRTVSTSNHEWVSPNHYRIELKVEGGAISESNSPASLNIDFTEKILQKNSSGVFDKSTVEVIAYDSTGAPVIFDGSRSGYERYLLPSRVDTYYGLTEVTLNFIVPDNNYTYMVYFDTEASGLGKPDRYSG